MHLMFILDDAGNRIYTLKVSGMFNDLLTKAAAEHCMIVPSESRQRRPPHHQRASGTLQPRRQVQQRADNMQEEVQPATDAAATQGILNSLSTLACLTACKVMHAVIVT